MRWRVPRYHPPEFIALDGDIEQALCPALATITVPRWGTLMRGRNRAGRGRYLYNAREPPLASGGGGA